MLTSGAPLCRRGWCIAAGLFASVALVACTDRPLPTQPTSRLLRFNIVASFQARSTAAARTVEFNVTYERTAGSSQPLINTRVALALDQRQVALTVDLGACLADSLHAGGARACTIDLTVSLLDDVGTLIDRQVLGHIVAAPGGTVTTDAVTLSTPTNPIAVSNVHACAIKAGTTYCWGSNGGGYLGDGTTTARYTAVPIAGGYRFVALAAAFTGSCGLTADSTVACWGGNLFGEVGDGTLTRNKSTPTPVVGQLHFKSLAAGVVQFCALTAVGEAYCWGTNQLGGLGDGTTTDRLVPTPVSGSLRFATLGLGMQHGCGITLTGAAYCWGDNISGDVGDGTTIQRLTPTLVSGGRTFVSITGGNAHSCALTVAGEAFCWGLNNSGELGDGTTTTRLIPTAVTGGHTFSAIQAAHNGNGEGSTCGLDTGGILYCWGSNFRGQLADGTVTNKSIPAAVAGGRRFTHFDLDNQGGCALAGLGTPYCWGENAFSGIESQVRLSPTQVKGGLSFGSMTAGIGVTCGVPVGSPAVCWGSNLSRAIGDTTALPRNSPQAVIGGITFVALSTSGIHTCGVAVGGAAYCWGSSNFGALGTGTSPATAPVAVAGGLTFGSIGVGGASSSGNFSCANTTTGAAFCWGTNSSGQLGDGTQSNRFTPAAVAGGRTYASLSVGAGGACALTPSGAGFCWGTNVNGELGAGTTAQLSATPLAVVGGLTFAAIARGNAHTCALTTAGVPYCWGSNATGQLGNGTKSPTPNTSPGLVSGGLTFVKIAAGANHSCGLTAAGTLYCWGSNVAGLLGDGTETERLTPVAVPGGLTFAGVTTGAVHTCAWTTTGQGYCWGLNTQGQVGDGTSTYSLVPVLVPLP